MSCWVYDIYIVNPQVRIKIRPQGAGYIVTVFETKDLSGPSRLN